MSWSRFVYERRLVLSRFLQKQVYSHMPLLAWTSSTWIQGSSPDNVTSLLILLEGSRWPLGSSLSEPQQPVSSCVLIRFLYSLPCFLGGTVLVHAGTPLTSHSQDAHCTASDSGLLNLSLKSLESPFGLCLCLHPIPAAIRVTVSGGFQPELLKYKGREMWEAGK